MAQRLTFLLIGVLIINSCRQAERSEELFNEAMAVYVSGPSDSTHIERSLTLTERALELNPKNLPALAHKATIFFIKKDIDGLLMTADDLIKLRPEKPFYLSQKAFYLELKGDSQKANEYYDKALAKYVEYLKKDSTDFDLMIEYVSVLEMSGDTILAGETLRRMKAMNFHDSQKQILDLYKKQSVTKEELLRFWTGEIGYGQLTGK